MSNGKSLMWNLLWKLLILGDFDIMAELVPDGRFHDMHFSMPIVSIQDHALQHTVGHVLKYPMPQMLEESVDVPKIVSHERFQGAIR